MSQRKEKSNKIESITYPSSSHPEITSTSHSQYNNQKESNQELINSTPRSFTWNNPSSTSNPYHPHYSSLDPQSSSANLSSQVLLRPSIHQNSHNYTHLSLSQVEMMNSQPQSDSIDPQSSSLTAQQPTRVLQVASPDNKDDSLEDRGSEVEQRSSSSQPSSLGEDGERVSRDGWSSNDHTEVHTPSSRTSREPTLASPAGGLEKEGIQIQGMEEISLADDPVGIQDMTISQDQTATKFIQPITSISNPQANPSVTPISPSRPPPTSSNWLSRSASKMSIGGGGGSNSRNRSSSVGSSNQSPNRSRPHTSSGSTSSSNSSSPFGFNRPRAGTWRKLPGAMSSALNLNNLSKEDLQESNPGSSTPSAMRTPKTSMYATIASPPPAPPFASTSKHESTEPPPLIPSSPNTDKRRLFARAPISRDSSSGSFKSPSTNQEEDINQRSSGARGFVKRMGSRTFFRGGKNSSETQLESSKFTQQSGESTDTLSSATESTTGQSVSSSTTRSAKRLSSDAAVGVGRASSLTAWAKRRSSKASIRSSINEPPSPRLRTSGHSLENSENSNRLSQSSHPRSSIDSSQSSVQSRETTDLDSGSVAASSEALPSASNGEGVPKRLSSWLFNVLGTDNQASSNTVSSPTALEDPNQDPSSSSRSRSQNNSSQNGSGSGLSSNLGSSSGGGLPAASRSKTSLLSSISASARARALGYAGAGQQQQGAGASSNGAGSSVGSGLDKALRYFLDSDSNSQNQAEEGIWLLGVWHGASTTNPNSASASNTSPPIGNSPYGQGPSIEVQTASPEVPVRRSKRSNTLPSSPSTSRSGASKQHSLEQVEEGIISPQRKDSSSITETPRTPSPHTPTSSDTDVHIVARNPPTPHTSPQPSKVSSKQPLIQSQPNSSSSNLPSSSAPTSSSGVGWQSTFQPDFSSRIWCTYRNHFAPIARDGTISDQAERAAADSARAAALVESNSSSPSTPALNIPQSPSSTTSVQSNINSGGRLWLGRRNNDNSSTSDLLSTANQVGASHSPTSRFTPGGLGAALGIGSGGSNSISSSPSSSNFNPSAPTASSSSSGLAAGLSEKMGIPGLWGRATAAAQAAGLGGRQGLTTDAGWGCMLRTGQSLLANALLNVHLGRTWSKEELSLLQNLFSASDDSADPSSNTSQIKGAKSRYATYVRLLSWFLDDPSSACPFSVHRMAREGKRLGKEVGEWFGPSTAAGAIKKLVDDYPQAGIGVSLATDGVVYRSHVRAAAVVDSERSWERPVLVLIGVRLGLEGVNPMYYDSVKDTFSFPQSVGIAGGRPSSSYYFMGFQGSSLFYLDPHHSRSAVPFRHPPPQFVEASNSPEEAEESDEWWCQAYSEAQLSTFHCDRIRRMPIKGLDPSMLLGFLCMDEASLDDLTSKVRSLNKPIFSIADAPPRWMGLEMGISKEGEEESQDLEDDLAIESFSESNGSESEDEGRNEDSVEDDSEDWIQEGNPREEEEDISGRETETVSGSTELEPSLKSSKEINKSLKKQLSSTSESNSIRFPVSNDSPNRPSSLSASNQSGSRHPSGTSESTFTQHHSNRNLTPLTTSNPSTSSYLGDESFSSVGSSDGEASPSWTQVSPDGRDSRPSASSVAESQVRRSPPADRSASEELEGSDKDDF